LSNDEAPTPGAAAVDEVLSHGDLTVEGRLLDASNASFLGDVSLDGVTLRCVYKPVAGERPLWDFPAGTLAAREVAARLVSEAGGWGVVPPTVLRDGPLGRGMCQLWVDIQPDRELVDVIPADRALDAWVPVLQAEDQHGSPVLLVHADDAALRSMAVFDVVVNNADRKGGHVLLDEGGSVWGCDHGVCFHEDPKLRTVLWGWGQEPLRPEDGERLDALAADLDGGLGERLSPLLATGEVEALRSRVRSLREADRMPVPAGAWPAIPWPPF
jgi:uncharacterized repeat protein (TIGR03843 family)